MGPQGDPDTAPLPHSPLKTPKIRSDPWEYPAPEATREFLRASFRKRNERKWVWHPRDPGWERQDWDEASPGGLRGQSSGRSAGILSELWESFGMIWKYILGCGGQREGEKYFGTV